MVKIFDLNDKMCYFNSVTEAYEYIITEIKENVKSYNRGYRTNACLKKEIIHKKIRLQLHHAEENNVFEYFSAYSVDILIKDIQSSSIETLEKEMRYVTLSLRKYEGYPIMSKAKEIELLEELAFSDSYFAEEFRSKFEKMKNNIINDLPIMFGL